MRQGRYIERRARVNSNFYVIRGHSYQALTKEQFNAEIEKGMEDIKAGKVYSADEIEAEMKREFGL